MFHAIIDLGSNTIRLSVYECEKDQVVKVFTEKEVAGLAGYISQGILQAAGIQKACAVLNNFKKSAYNFVELENIHLFATASLRNISNRNEAVKIITEETSLIPDVLTGEEEAMLEFSGVSHFVNCEKGILVDIGGASTELVLFKDYKAVKFTSLPIGCLNLSIECVNKIIPTEPERKQIKTLIKDQLSRIDWVENEQYPLMVGTGGTLRAVLKLSRVLFDIPSEQNDIKSGHTKEISKRIKNNTDNIYRTIYQVIPERLLTITTGLAILQQAIKKFGCETILVSKFGIREGYLIDRVLKINDRYEDK